MHQSSMSKAIDDILKQNEARHKVINRRFNPVTGEGSIGERFKASIDGFPIAVQQLPVTMKKVPLVKLLMKYGVDKMAEKISDDTSQLDEAREKVIEQFVRIRNRHDFAFWAATLVHIQSKNPGEGEILFKLNRPQRMFIERLEEKRVAGKPIRFVLLKARQWGGSTASQLYMMWLQVVHKVGLNSVIISQTKKTSFAIKAMFDRALESYPTALLHRMGEAYKENEKKIENVGLSGDYKRVPQRDCTITIASYEAPDALRGDAYALVHCSEVGLWAPTDKKSPESVVRSATSGIAYRPYTMIIWESTANGTGNFFHREYEAAKNGISQYDAIFISWSDIDLYSIPFENEKEKLKFAKWLYENRNNENVNTSREEPGKYLWWLWEKQGATLEAINWYVTERSGKSDHAVMAAEYPSDDIEAFVHSGAMVFDRYLVEELRPTCRPPRYVGDVYTDDDRLENVRFKEDNQGLLWVWAEPEVDDKEIVTDRYLVVVDIGGRSHKADWSVIVVFDRLFMIDGEKPSVVAQWYGHIDMDRLAWKAAQVAAYYDNALLVIEANTYETHDPQRQLGVDGDQSLYILNQVRQYYDNLYARKQSPEDIQAGNPRKYGYHVNTGTKPTLISNLQTVIRDQLYVERDERCIDEFLKYERKQNGAWGAIAGEHDDLLMTRAIGLYICFREMELPKIKQRQQHVLAKRAAVSEASI